MSDINTGGNGDHCDIDYQGLIRKRSTPCRYCGLDPQCAVYLRRHLARCPGAVEVTVAVADSRKKERTEGVLDGRAGATSTHAEPTHPSMSNTARWSNDPPLGTLSFAAPLTASSATCSTVGTCGGELTDTAVEPTHSDGTGAGMARDISVMALMIELVLV